jgi:hypothetical protein
MPTEYFVTTGGSSLNDGLSETTAWDLATGLANLTSNVRINIKAGLYDALVYNGIGGSPVFNGPGYVRGYATTGDLDGANLGRDSRGMLNTGSMPVLKYQLNNVWDFDSVYLHISNLIVYTSGTNTTCFTIGGQACVYNCYLQSVGINSADICSVGTNGMLINCDVSAPSIRNSGVLIKVANMGRLDGCRLWSVYGSGIAVQYTGGTAGSAKGMIVNRCVIYDHLHAITLKNTIAAGANLQNNTIVRCSGNAIETPAASYTAPIYITDNVVTDCSRFINQPSAQPTISINNRTRNIRLADVGLVWEHVVSVTGVNNPIEYVDYTNNNFYLTSNSPARKAATVSNQDIGGLQGYDNYGFAGGQ